MKWKLILVFFLILLWNKKGFAYPDCTTITSIEEYNQLDDAEKLFKTHPYLLLAYCKPNESEKFINLFVDLFKQPANVNQLLHAISIEIRRANRSKNSKQFFNILKNVNQKIVANYPNLKNDLRFINSRFVYLSSQSSYENACDYLFENSINFDEEYPEKLEVIFYYVSISNCAAYREDFNTSILALIKGLEYSETLEKPYNRLKKGHFLKLLSMRNYDVKEYNKALNYANLAIETFKPEHYFNTGTGVAYEQKGLAHYKLFKNIDSASNYFEKAQQIHQKNKNISRANYVNKLKSETNLDENTELAINFFFKYFNYFQENKRNNHQIESWLLANRLLSEYKINKLRNSNSQSISHQQVMDSLAAFLPKETLKNQLKISSALITFYNRFLDNDSLYKYNQLQNRFEAERNEISIKNRQNSVDLFLKNYKSEQELANLNLLNQKQSYKNKLLTILICFSLISLIFYYFYKRKQKRILKTKLLLKETQNEKLKTEQKLKEELILRKEQDEEILKLAYDNEMKRKKLLQLELKEKQNQLETAEIEKQTSLSLLNEVFTTLRDKKVNDASHLIRKLQTNEIITKQNNSLKDVFASISPNFINQLNNINSNLTEQDILYCVLVRQKYTTKQISNFLNISPKSVNQHKYRLKKKLEISKDEGINQLIAKIDSD